MHEITDLVNENEERDMKKLQRRELKRIRRLLISIKADEAMVDAIDQALLDNEQW